MSEESRNKAHDRALGMDSGITRRDFMNATHFLPPETRH